MRHLISLKEQSRDDLLEIIDMAQTIKAKRQKGELTNYLPNKTLIMMFQKTSTRTRLSFESGMTELGGHSIFLDTRTSQFSLTDFGDEVQAVMRYGDVLMFRAMRADDVGKTASYNYIPVIDACSERYHPCQALGDLLTMAEYSKGLENVKKIVWLGIENNVSNTLKLACAKLGIEIAVVTPDIDPISIDKELNEQADSTGKVKYTLDIAEALDGADYVHTDTWTNMEFFENGKVKPEFEDKYKASNKKFMPYQLNAQIIDQYAPKARIMHCMPCHIGYEISRDAVDHPRAIIFDQAENRMHIQKGIIMWLLEKKIPLN